jgi:hypothetical protein
MVVTGQKKDTKAGIKNYLLLGKDESSAHERCRWWQREGIYLSNVCLAVHLTVCLSGFVSEEDFFSSKESLYGYLRRVGQATLDHDVMRPIACVIVSSEPLYTKLHSWAADQEWHRGSFLLYFETEDGVWDRLLDLLDAKPDVFYPEYRDPRTEKEIIKQLATTIKREHSDEMAGEFAKELLARIREVISLKRQDDSPQKLAEDLIESSWGNAVIGASNRIAHRRRVP